MSANFPFDVREKLRTELTARIEAARTALESPQPDEWANLIRGEIRSLRSLLEWIAPPPPKQPEPEHRRLMDPPEY